MIGVIAFRRCGVSVFWCCHARNQCGSTAQVSSLGLVFRVFFTLTVDQPRQPAVYPQMACQRAHQAQQIPAGLRRVPLRDFQIMNKSSQITLNPKKIDGWMVADKNSHIIRANFRSAIFQETSIHCQAVVDKRTSASTNTSGSHSNEKTVLWERQGPTHATVLPHNAADMALGLGFRFR